MKCHLIYIELLFDCFCEEMSEQALPVLIFVYYFVSSHYLSPFINILFWDIASFLPRFATYHSISTTNYSYSVVMMYSSELLTIIMSAEYVVLSVCLPGIWPREPIYYICIQPIFMIPPGRSSHTDPFFKPIHYTSAFNRFMIQPGRSLHPDPFLNPFTMHPSICIQPIHDSTRRDVMTHLPLVSIHDDCFHLTILSPFYSPLFLVPISI
jgi:hypothetical protein